MPEEHDPSFFQRLLKAKGGDKSALGRLLSPFLDRLRADAQKALSPAMAQEVGPSDVVQQTALAAGKNVEKFRGTTTAEWFAYLRGTMRRIVWKIVGRNYEHVAVKVPLPGQETGAELLAGDDTSVVQQLDDQDRNRLLHEAIEALEELDQQIIRFKFFEPVEVDATYDQLSARTGQSAANLRQRMCRLLKRLEAGLLLLQTCDRLRLPPHYRHVLKLRHFRGYSPGRIALEMKCSERTAKTLLEKAISALPDNWKAQL